MDSKKIISRFGTCSKDCYGSCVFIGEWNDDEEEHKLKVAKPLLDHPFTNGIFCKKFTNREKLIYHNDRIKQPLIRKGHKGNNLFESATLEVALTTIVTKLKEVIEKYGSKSILGSYYSGNSGIISQNFPIRFFRKLGGTVTTGGICNEGGNAGLTSIFGTHSISNPMQLSNLGVKLIVVWGSDITEKNNHAYLLIKRALKHGASLVVIDCQKTKISEEAHLFLQINPGSDYFLSKYLIKMIINENFIDEEFVQKHTAGYPNLRQKIISLNTIECLNQLGIGKEKTIAFFSLLKKHKHKTIFNIGYGLQKTKFGGRIVRTIALIQVLLGNIAKPSAGLLYSQSGFNYQLIRPIIDKISGKSSSSHLNKIPLIKLGSELSSGDYKFVIVYNFNPLASIPDLNKLKNAIIDNQIFVITHELFLNETTKYADIVIPAKFDAETYDILSPYYYPSLSVNIAGPCPYPECLSNYEFFQILTKKMNLDPINNSFRSEKDFYINHLNLLPNKIVSEINKNGYHSTFKINDVPYKNLKFLNPDGKIIIPDDIFEFEDEITQLKSDLEYNEFQLLTPSHPFLLHSQLGLLNPDKIKEFGNIYLNHADIEQIGLKHGILVKVQNEYGKAIYHLKQSDDLKIGTAMIYSGFSSLEFNFPNANLFIPDVPEEMGGSGSYNLGVVKITIYDE